MDSEQFNNLVNNITNAVTQVGTAAGSIYSSFRGSSNSGSSPVTNNYVSSQTQTSSLPVWLLPVVGLGVLLLLFFKD